MIGEYMSAESSVRKPSVVKTPDADYTGRILKTGFLIGALLTFLFFATNRLYMGWGFLIGASLSLFSFVTIAITVPFLMRPSAPRSTPALIGVLLFMKLPIYCAALYLAARLPGMAAFACMLGVCLIPTIITLKTMGAVLKKTLSAFQTDKPAHTQSGTATSAAQPVKAAPSLSLPTDLTPEQG